MGIELLQPCSLLCRFLLAPQKKSAVELSSMLLIPHRRAEDYLLNDNVANPCAHLHQKPECQSQISAVEKLGCRCVNRALQYK